MFGVPFSSFKGKTQTYLLKTSITRNKSPLLYLLVNCLSTKPASQILFPKEKYSLRVSNFIVVGLCNTYVYCFLSELIPVTS